MSKLIALILVVILYLAESSALFAYGVPSFTSCLNPQGEVKASYESGTHGIAGQTGLYEGKDAVYKFSENTLTQCFCAENGSGIQTNWWKIPNLTESEIKTLEAQAWIYIANGALWGLDDAPYMAKNSDYRCKTSGGNVGSSDSGSSSDSNSSSSSSSNSSTSGITGKIGQVLGLASTGNTILVLATALTSGLSLILGLILKKRATFSSK